MTALADTDSTWAKRCQADGGIRTLDTHTRTYT